jgi:hypothetical protein
MKMSPYFFEIWVNQCKDVIILPIDEVCQGNCGKYQGNHDLPFPPMNHISIKAKDASANQSDKPQNSIYY